MAQRKTLKAAKELKAQFEATDPEETFVIDIQKGESQVHPLAIEAEGLQDKIVRWVKNKNGKEFPVVAWTVYNVVQVMTCPSCQTEWHSNDIGGASLCGKCSTQRDREDYEVRSDTASKLKADQAREDWCQ